MGRHIKAKKAELLRREEELAHWQQVSDNDVDAPTPSSTSRTQTSKKSKRAAAANQSPSSSALVRCLRNKNDAKVSRFDLVKLVEKLAFAVSGLGDSEDVKKYFTEDELIDGETLRNLQRNVHTIKKPLEHLGNVTDVPEFRPASTASHHSEYMVYRPKGDKLLYLLSVAEVFRPNSINYNRRKTLAFVRAKGSTAPMKCALSGWSNVLEDHPSMLNTQEWLTDVKYWAENFGHKFKNGPWDQVHKKDAGDGHASHCEPCLMIWWACYMVNKIYGPYTSRREAIQNIWRLSKQALEAELVVSREPCDECKRFARLVQEATKINFTFVKPMANVAEVAMIKNSMGYGIYPRLAPQDKPAEREIENAIDMILEYMPSKPIVNNRISVEIPISLTPQVTKATTVQLPHTPKSQTQYSKNPPTNSNQTHVFHPPKPVFFEEVLTTSKVEQKKTIRDLSRFVYKNPNNNFTFEPSDDESEYVPETPSRSRLGKIYRSSFSTPQKSTSQWLPPTPESARRNESLPFSEEAIRLAKELKRKKKREALEAKESAAKRGRWDGYK